MCPWDTWQWSWRDCQKARILQTRERERIKSWANRTPWDCRVWEALLSNLSWLYVIVYSDSIFYQKRTKGTYNYCSWDTNKDGINVVFTSLTVCPALAPGPLRDPKSRLTLPTTMVLTNWPTQNLWLGWVVKGFSCWRQSVKTGRGECFSKRADTNRRLQGSWGIRKTWHHKRNEKKAAVTGPKEMEIYKLSDKEFKIIIFKNEKASHRLGENIRNLCIWRRLMSRTYNEVLQLNNKKKTQF